MTREQWAAIIEKELERQSRDHAAFMSDTVDSVVLYDGNLYLLELADAVLKAAS